VDGVAEDDRGEFRGGVVTALVIKAVAQPKVHVVLPRQQGQLAQLDDGPRQLVRPARAAHQNELGMARLAVGPGHGLRAHAVLVTLEGE
jgi:hypothetical protein